MTDSRNSAPRPASVSADADLLAWSTHVLSAQDQRPGAHHRLLISELEQVADGSADRLMVLMPPGSAKSTYASVLFPPWWFVRHPRSSVIAASHTQELAAHFGRQVRDKVQEHPDWLRYRLQRDNRAAARWQTTEGGQYFATGVRGPIIGRRADLVIIDDPVKSQFDADAALQREHVWNWFRSDLTTRLKPHGRIVLIMTRWHEDDLGGRLLDRQRGEWRVLRLPALAEIGDPLGRPEGRPLWPEWEDHAALARKRASVGERAWSALFQQSPQPPGGSLFRIGALRAIPAAEVAEGRAVRAWDFAATEKRDGNNPDYTVGLKLLRETSGRFVVLDVKRLQGSPHEVEKTVLNKAIADGPGIVIGLPQDPGSAGKTAVFHLANKLAGYALNISRETGSKVTRAGPVSSQIEAGNLVLIKAHWNADLIEELAAFPNGVNDDQVDALSRAFSMLTATAAPARRQQVALMQR